MRFCILHGFSYSSKYSYICREMFYNCFTKKYLVLWNINFVTHTIMAIVNHTILKHQKKSDNT